MKQTTLLQGAVMAVLVLILGVASSGGPAANGLYFTGAPSTGGGTELTCSICHNSGTGDFGEPQVSWTIAASEGGPNETTYVPGETYFVTVNVTAPMGNPAGYGFSSTFLNGGTNEEAGTPFLADENTRFTDANGVRTYVEHRYRTPSGTWNFRWIAPTDGTGVVNIYSAGNAVNGMDGLLGDSGSTSSTVITLTEAVLPVNLEEFDAVADKSTVELSWSTASEDDLSHFEVERSVDGESFLSVGHRSASGNNRRPQSYDFTDRTVPAGDIYYRLRMVDFTGSFSLGPVVRVRVTAEGQRSVFPNPATTHVTVGGELEETTIVRLRDGTGRIVRSRRGSGTLDVAELRAGVYLVETVRAGIPTVSKLVKH